MKEQKNSIGMSLSDNPPTVAHQRTNRNDLRHRFSELKNEIHLLLCLTAMLL